MVPFTMDRFLRDMEYPATKDDLLREAAREALSERDRELIESLPDRTYPAGWHVRRALAPRTIGVPREPVLV
ncbi:DUF2795 domain-containing protein [Microbacterium sp. ZW T5_56]|uniref:DUF2795 domain-containing protein n=1 Tax=Microbacterium sp. ZW T5_56 TaxID=3378081 RepID=UPI00385318D8